MYPKIGCFFLASQSPTCRRQVYRDIPALQIDTKFNNYHPLVPSKKRKKIRVWETKLVPYFP